MTWPVKGNLLFFSVVFLPLFSPSPPSAQNSTWRVSHFISYFLLQYPSPPPKLSLPIFLAYLCLCPPQFFHKSSMNSLISSGSSFCLLAFSHGNCFQKDRAVDDLPFITSLPQTSDCLLNIEIQNAHTTAAGCSVSIFADLIHPTTVHHYYFVCHSLLWCHIRSQLLTSVQDPGSASTFNVNIGTGQTTDDPFPGLPDHRHHHRHATHPQPRRRRSHKNNNNNSQQDFSGEGLSQPKCFACGVRALTSAFGLVARDAKSFRTETWPCKGQLSSASP